MVVLTDYFLEKINKVASYYGAEKALYYLNELCNYAYYDIYPQDIFLKNQLNFRKDSLIIDSYKKDAFTKPTVPTGRILEYKIKGLTPQEIAGKVGLSSSTVRKRLNDFMNESAINRVIIEKKPNPIEEPVESLPDDFVFPENEDPRITTAKEALWLKQLGYRYLIASEVEDYYDRGYTPIENQRKFGWYYLKQNGYDVDWPTEKDDEDWASLT